MVNQLREHLKWPHPGRLGIVDRPVYGQQLFRLGVACNVEELVSAALEVAIQAWGRGSLVRRSLSGCHELMIPPQPDVVSSERFRSALMSVSGANEATACRRAHTYVH